eukprot:3740640-Karenia_brevis.AAC.1
MGDLFHAACATACAQNCQCAELWQQELLLLVRRTARPQIYGSKNSSLDMQCTTLLPGEKQWHGMLAGRGAHHHEFRFIF